MGCSIRDDIMVLRYLKIFLIHQLLSLFLCLQTYGSVFEWHECNCQSSTLAVRVLDGSQQKADVVKTDYSDSL